MKIYGKEKAPTVKVEALLLVVEEFCFPLMFPVKD